MISINATWIKEEAKRIGFFTCGIAKAEPVDEEVQKGIRNG